MERKREGNVGIFSSISLIAIVDSAPRACEIKIFLINLFRYYMTILSLFIKPITFWRSYDVLPLYLITFANENEKIILCQII